MLLGEPEKMTERLALDLALWEEGILDRAGLERRHPGEDIGGMLALHIRLATGHEPAPEPAWVRIEGDPAAGAGLVRQLRHVVVIKPIVAAAAAVLLTASLASTTIEPFREGLNRTWTAAVRLFDPASTPPLFQLFAGE
jgi:hypothetical protein